MLIILLRIGMVPRFHRKHANGARIVASRRHRGVILLRAGEVPRLTYRSGPVAQWIRRWSSEPKIPGSSPGGIDIACPVPRTFILP